MLIIFMWVEWHSRKNFGKEHCRVCTRLSLPQTEMICVTFGHTSLAKTVASLNWQGKEKYNEWRKGKRIRYRWALDISTRDFKTLVDFVHFIYISYSCMSTSSHTSLPSGTNEDESLKPKRLPFLETISWWPIIFLLFLATRAAFCPISCLHFRNSILSTEAEWTTMSIRKSLLGSRMAQEKACVWGESLPLRENLDFNKVFSLNLVLATFYFLFSFHRIVRES